MREPIYKENRNLGIHGAVGKNETVSVFMLDLKLNCENEFGCHIENF
jgi:hypothetical protein